MMFKSLSPKRSRRSDTITVSAENHSTDAEEKPRMNAAALLAGRLARNAPMSSVPSMMACGLSHVTTKAEPASFKSGAPVSTPVSSFGFERKSPTPIQMTTRLPAAKTILRSHGSASISAPMPKKHARLSEISSAITISAMGISRRFGCVSAALMTNKFCIPMGAT